VESDREAGSLVGVPVGTSEWKFQSSVRNVDVKTSRGGRTRGSHHHASVEYCMMKTTVAH
jgi:hypothetical protein